MLQDSFVANLLRIIQHMKSKPVSKGSANNVNDTGIVNKGDKSMLSVMFPGLSIPNDKRRMSSSEDEEKTSESDVKNNIDQTEVDGMMAALESLAPSKLPYVIPVKRWSSQQNSFWSIILIGTNIWLARIEHLNDRQRGVWKVRTSDFLEWNAR